MTGKENLGQAVLALATDDSDLDTGLLAAERKASSWVGRVGGILGKGLLVGGAVAVGAGVAVAAGLAEAVGAAREAEAIQAQLNAVIKSTGGVANVTANEANDLASSLSMVTAFEDDAIVSGEALLLTFTNIGEDIFPQATETMLDMSQALGQDLKSSAVQLGKALNDPIKGVTALQRVGVSFTESQKKQIETLVKSGKTLEAQKIILRELQTEFGGAARAVGDTLEGKMAILGNTLGNIKEGVGTALIPVLTDLLDEITPRIQEFAGHLANLVGVLGDQGWASSEALKELQGMFGEEWGTRIQNAGIWLGEVATNLFAVGTAIATYGLNSPEAFAALTSLLGSEQNAAGVIDTLNGISAALRDLGNAWNGIKGFVDGVTDFLNGLNEWSTSRGGQPLVGSEAPWFGGLDIDKALDGWHKATAAQQDVAAGAGPAKDAVGQLDNAISGASSNASDFGGSLTALGGILQGNFPNPFGGLAGTLNAAADAGARLLGLLEQIKTFVGAGGASMFGAGGASGFGPIGAGGGLPGPGSNAISLQGWPLAGLPTPQTVRVPRDSQALGARPTGPSGVTVNGLTIHVPSGDPRAVAQATQDGLLLAARAMGLRG